MSRKYFGTDGIRGRANGLITPELALKVGQAAGLVFQRGDHRQELVAVDEMAALVDDDHAIGVAVERDADIGPHFPHLPA